MLRVGTSSNPVTPEQLRVFIAEDSAAIRLRIVALVSDLRGVQCAGWADNVEAAIAGIRETLPDGLILDLQLVGGSGLQVLEAARAADPKLRVAVCSNWLTTQHRNACYAAGAEYVLEKSTEFADLRAVLQRWANRPPQQDERSHSH